MSDALVSRGAAAGEVVERTLAALRVALVSPKARLVTVLGTLAYLLVYLFATGDLAFSGDRGISVLIVSDPSSRIFQSIGYLSFEPIARVQAAGFTYLFSPIDAGLAFLLAALVGANLGLTYLGITQPRACGLESSAGVLAALPALLSGAACCGPVILVVVGIQATGVILTGFQFLVPIALALLVGSLLLVGRQVDTTLLEA